MRIFLTISFVTLVVQAKSQGCDNPQVLCGEMPTTVNLSALQPISYGCIDAPYTHFLEFTTNLNPDFTGQVQVSFEGFSCATSNVPDLIHAVVVEPNQQDFCDDLAYTPVTPCVDFSDNYSLISSNLSPNSQYLLILGTSHEPTTSPCSITVTVTGDAIGINACCTANLAQGQSADLTVSGGDPLLGYTWFPDYFISSTIGDAVTVAPDVTTTYSVSGFIGACAYVDDVQIKVGDALDVPNSFTPNDDGFNDFWLIPDLIPYDRARLLVYDRWGQIVHRSTGYPQPWDGFSDGKPVPEGAYYYTIDLNDSGLDLPTQTGSITLVR